MLGEYDPETSTTADHVDEDDDGDGFGDVSVSAEDLLRQVAAHDAAQTAQASKKAAAALKRTLAADIKRMEMAALNPMAAHPGDGGVMIAGLDAEWEQIDEETNWILSAQVHVPPQECFRRARDDDEADKRRIERQIAGLSRIIYAKSPAKKDRPRLKPALTAVIARAIATKLLPAPPSLIVVAGFGLRFDLPALGDFHEIKTQVDSVSGHLATVHTDTSIEFDWGEVDAERAAKRQARREARAAEAPVRMRENIVLTEGAERTRIAVRFVDTMLFVPEGTSLHDVGEMVNLPKLPIPAPHSIERMSAFLEADKPAYEEYAKRDAEIAARYYMQLEAFARDRLGVKRLPATVSGLAQRWFLDGLTTEQWMKSFGLHRVRHERWDNKQQRYFTKTEIEPIPMRAVVDDLITRCYHGGRNECLTLGPSDPDLGTITDFDLAAAYTTGLVDLPVINFDRPEPSKNLQDFLDNKIGFALVTFEHPAHVRVPVLPVRDGDRGLVFCMKGESYATAPEIQVAHAMGVKLDVRVGFYYRTADTGLPDDRMFYPVVRRVRELRGEFKREEAQRAERAGEEPRKSIKELTVKLMGNALYGRLSMGLRPRRAYDARGQEYVDLRKGPLSNPAYAAHATGLIRAVLGEILNRIPREHLIASVTTDGFLTSADVEDIDLTGPMCRRYQQLCDWVLPGSPMLEVKHRVGQVLAMKTRGQLTTRIKPAKPEYKGMTKPLDEIVLAKAGVQPQIEVRRGEDREVIRRRQNDAMLDMYLNRTHQSQVTVRSFPAIRDVIEMGSDMIRGTRLQRMSLEPDMKRRLVNPRELLVASRGVTHIAADSVPWNTLAEFRTARARLDRFRREHAMKAVTNFNVFDQMLVEGLARRDARGQGLGVLNGGKDGALGKLRRAFLRAAAKDALGVTIELSATELAEKLTGFGMPTNAQHVKDAGRANAKLVQYGVPRTPEVMAMCAVLAESFPGADVDQLLIPVDR